MTLSKKTKNKDGVAVGFIPYVVFVLVLVIAFTTFYISGWLTLSPVATSDSNRINMKCCISDAIDKYCENKTQSTVEVCGIITRDEAQCCDFFLKDETGEILIEDNSSYGLLLPSRVGRKATIFGTLTKRGLVYVITDTRIEFH
ncbi:MAG: hypothetical protein R2883_05550 [Caldisericia bacterium]